MAEDSPETERDVGSRLTLDIWHPDCWTLRVTERTAGGLLGHGVHEVDGRALGRFTAYANTAAQLAALVDAVRESPLTADVWPVEARRRSDDAPAPGSATQSLIVSYDLEKSVNDALVSRGFIPDEPVRIYGGREYWTVVVHRDREEIRSALSAVRAEMDADVRVEGIVAADDRPGSGMFRANALSERQREAFELARERGYYEWPRAVSAADLAEEVGVSKATLLEHLRKAESKLLDPD